jgi:hypothetical protein
MIAQSLVTWLRGGPRNHGLIPGTGSRFFPSPNTSRLALWFTECPVHLALRSLSLWHDLTTCLRLLLKVKNEWSYTKTTQYAFIACMWTTLLFMGMKIQQINV